MSQYLLYKTLKIGIHLSMKYLLKTSYPCVVKNSNSYLELEQNDTIEIENENFVFVYPEYENSIPFCINLTNLRENANYSVLTKNQNKIILLERATMVQTASIVELNFSGKICKIEISEKSLCFIWNNKKITYKVSHSSHNFEVLKIKQFACVQFEKDFYAFSTTKNQLSHFCGDKIELSQDTIKVQKKFHDSLNREKNSIYKFEDDIILQNEEFFQNSTTNIPALVPYRVMESLRAKDFQYLIQNLSNNLQNSLKSTNICDFFGNFSDFLPVNETDFITLSSTAKNYVSFAMNGEKIEDITIDEL